MNVHFSQLLQGPVVADRVFAAGRTRWIHRAALIAWPRIAGNRQTDRAANSREYFGSGFPHPQAGHFRFGESAQSHSPGARVVADGDCPARFARCGVALTAHPCAGRANSASCLRPSGLTLLAPVLVSRYGYENWKRR